MDTPKAFCYEDSLIIDRLNSEIERLREENAKLRHEITDRTKFDCLECVKNEETIEKLYNINQRKNAEIERLRGIRSALDPDLIARKIDNVLGRE